MVLKRSCQAYGPRVLHFSRERERRVLVVYVFCWGRVVLPRGVPARCLRSAAAVPARCRRGAGANPAYRKR